jgi:D-3-phosphoglycerate dehydrogenase
MEITGKFIDDDNPLQPQVQNVEVLINGSSYIDKSKVDDASNLRLIDQLGIRVDNVVVEYFPVKGILVAEVPLVNSVSVAEHTIFLMLYLTKNVRNYRLHKASTLRRRESNSRGS